MIAQILPIMLRIFIVFAIWGSVWHYMQPKTKANRILRAVVLVIALLFAAGLISMTI
jgi:quinol-cytochrome oxidoreductase complex cytochrome b subunit